MAKPSQAVKDHQVSSHPPWLMNPVLQHALSRSLLQECVVGCAEEDPDAHSEGSLPAVPAPAPVGCQAAGRMRFLKVTAQHERLLPACVQEETKPIRDPLEEINSKKSTVFWL